MTETQFSTQLRTETQRASDLIEWYWNKGHKRPLPPARPDAAGVDREKYRLHLDQWLAPLYGVRDALRNLGEARRPRRPALALWGLSQTGKSTALAFVDGNIALPGVEGEDGKQSGLHWEGGAPFIYQPPLRKSAPDYWNRCAYNPFNGEDDGSSCLTRLVAGEQRDGNGISDPRHPVQVRLLTRLELLNTIARGYDTQCLGPGKSGRHEPWEVSKREPNDTRITIEETIDRLASKYRPRGGDQPMPDRVAFERVLRLIMTIEDLHAVNVETFSRLAGDRAALRLLLDRLLLQKECFISNPAAADAVTAAILWGGADYITGAFARLRTWHEKLVQQWGNRPVYATLATAMLLVDFGSGINRLKGRVAAPRQRIQGELISTLGWRMDGERIVIGSGAEYSNRLGATPEDYAMIQALIWELVLPVNMRNLPDSPGKQLLAQADILDFPGVGKDALNESSRLNLGVGNPGEGKKPEPTDFFGKILKRGKTASVVANYATRRNIDTFAVLQSLKSDTAPSAEMVGQIKEGCEAWARYAGYDTDVEATSPLPLHFVLTFWGLKAQKFTAGTESNFQNTIGKLIESYGWIRTRSTAWALNYHWFRTPEGKVLAEVDVSQFDIGTEDYRAVVSEREFLAVYGSPVSRESFDEMLRDRATGGLNYFLKTIALHLSGIDMDARRRYLDGLSAEQIQLLQSLCAFPYLRPPSEERDSRIETIAAFRRRIIEAAAPFGEAPVREVSYALREFLNVDPELLPYPPLDPEQLDPGYIDRLFFIWREAQLRRYDHWQSGARGGEPDWNHLCCSTREQLGEVLQAYVECLGDKVCASIGASAQRWLRTLRGFQTEYRAHHLRRYVAAEMVNWLWYFFPDPERPDVRRRPAAARDARWKYDWGDDPEERSATPCLKTAAWRHGVAPLLEEQFAYVLGTKSKKPERPDLPGDEELPSLLPALD